jgi:disulfide bond formation protein DsbB
MKLKKLFYISLLIFASGALVSSYIAEIFFHYRPCILCYYQRYGFIVLAITAIWSYRYKLFYIGSLIVLFSLLCLNSYHIGVEQKWWNPMEACIRKHVDLKSIQDLPLEKRVQAYQNQLLQTPVTRCDEVQWRIFTIPITIWAELCLIFFLLWGVWVWTYKKP